MRRDEEGRYEEEGRKSDKEGRNEQEVLKK